MYKLRKNKIEDKQIGFIAVSITGEIGAYALREGFTYTYRLGDGVDVIKSADFLI
jgi:hypothetical protein